MLLEPLVSLFTTAVSGPFVVLVVIGAAMLATQISRLVIRRAIKQIARRNLIAGGAGDGGWPGSWWRTRLRRVGDERNDVIEHRRRQRIDAASRMISHLVSIVIWIAAAIVLFHLLDVDPAFFLSSAGFIGAGLAIGGQHKVNDYLSGLLVHVEDRYGIGDEIVADVGWTEPMRGIVDHVGLFSTRVRDPRSTMHFPNHALASVRNLSQEAPATTLRISGRPDEAASVLRGLAGTDGLTDVVFLGDLAVREGFDGETEIDVATSRPLAEPERDRLVARAERAIGGLQSR
ncbi:MAG: mechanosensitive ion channel [Ilumatobacter sp.]|nr:mechanosensitive ion channel [Ilumatobacter sp.]